MKIDKSLANENLWNKQISLLDIIKANREMSKYLKPTPTVKAYSFSNQLGINFYLKLENTQPVNSFKVRGALNKILNLSDAEKQKGVIAASAGNHAQGVALAATEFGIKSYIVMPDNAPLTKVNNTRKYGGEVIFSGDNTFDSALEKAIRLSKERNLVMIPPYEDISVIAGQGTIALEIFNDLDDVDTIVVPIGGGGLIAGIALTAKTFKPEIRIIGVESENVPSVYNAIKNKEWQILDPSLYKPTIADGIAVKRPGLVNYQMILSLVDEIVLVNETEIQDTITHILSETKTVVEGAGAVAAASVIYKKFDFKPGENIVAIASGGNVDNDKLINHMLNTLNREKLHQALKINITKSNYGKILEILIANSVKFYTNSGVDLKHNIQYGMVTCSLFTTSHGAIEKVTKAFEKEKIIYSPIFEIN
ncbi:threonine dehydratase [Mycoplasma testudineum]|uniref:Threonine dehydratase n=1 Tax=Mycoplasma testudineum TaxID=244584 RepID=A0A4R6IEX7_9MOLU|nr:threonine/serine dehydratase [Mycoplasma testudineum]OYD26996.1 threonine ammonia-lyase [Mycoplasma testudineum]TDO20544.1 threonine dehydratase [Mycoplasma testudineum]